MTFLFPGPIHTMFVLLQCHHNIQRAYCVLPCHVNHRLPQCRARPCIQNNIREFRRDRTRRRGDRAYVHDIFTIRHFNLDVSKISGAAMQRYFVTMNPAFSEIARENVHKPENLFYRTAAQLEKISFLLRQYPLTNRVPHEYNRTFSQECSRVLMDLLCNLSMPLCRYDNCCPHTSPCQFLRRFSDLDLQYMQSCDDWLNALLRQITRSHWSGYLREGERIFIQHFKFEWDTLSNMTRNFISKKSTSESGER